MCNSPHTKKLLNLGYQPNGNELLKNKYSDTKNTELLYFFCFSCFSIFQNYAFSDDEMYLDHPYITSHNKQYVQELKNFAELVSHEINLVPGDLVLDNAAGSGSTGLACQNTKRNFSKRKLLFGKRKLLKGMPFMPVHAQKRIAKA